MSDVHATDDGSFAADVLESDKPVLVDFWAPWCGPCRAIAPLVDQLAKERGEVLKICKVNVDENRDTAVKYNVRGIPTLLLFKNGEVAAQHVGALSHTQLVAFVDQHTSED